MGQTPGSDHTALCIAICDEDPQIRSEVTRLARAQTFDVIEAESGHQALASLIVGDVL